MGRNARRTHNLKNKQGVRGGGVRGWRGWKEGCAERIRRKRGKSQPGFSVRLHGFARATVAVGGAKGARGHISRAEGRANVIPPPPAGGWTGGVLRRREGGCAAP